MESISKLENTIGGWMKSFPHLPENARKWIAKYSGIIATVGLGLSILGFIAYVAILLMAMGLLGYLLGPIGIYAYSSTIIVTTVIVIVDIVVTIALTAMAIKPLKALDKKGWDLLFLLTLISIAFSVVSTVFSLDAYSIFSGLIGVAISFLISMYFLFEIRSYFKVGGNKIVDEVKQAKKA